MKSAQPLAVGLAIVAMAAVANAQSFNVDVSLDTSAPPPATYAAAGLAGEWNGLTAEHNAPDVLLVDIDGNQTSVGFHQNGGFVLATTNDPSVGGDDATLLNDYIGSPSPEPCMYLEGLEDGTYEVITYAWIPDSPGTLREVWFDFIPGSALVGGAWPGRHVEGVTYSRQIVEVTGGSRIGWHVQALSQSGGGSAAGLQAAFNGFQIRQLGATTPVPTLRVGGAVVLAAMLLAAGVRSQREHDGSGDSPGSPQCPRINAGRSSACSMGAG